MSRSTLAASATDAWLAGLDRPDIDHETVARSIAEAVQHAVTATTLHAPAHFDVEVLSALARLHRAGHLSDHQIKQRLGQVRTAPIERHAVGDLLEQAWAMRHNMRITDAVYLALAADLDTRVITTDHALVRAAPE